MSKPLCSWCFRPLGDIAERFNGGIGHPECIAWAWETLTAGDPDAMPWARPIRLYRADPAIAFFRRLAVEAAKEGIDCHKLARAIGRAAP